MMWFPFIAALGRHLGYNLPEIYFPSQISLHSFLALVNVLPTVVGIALSGLLKNCFWMIWYPIIYWVIPAATSVTALPKILLRDTEKRARWTSPDRGIKPDASR